MLAFLFPGIFPAADCGHCMGRCSEPGGAARGAALAVFNS